jgi:ApaG protein
MITKISEGVKISVETFYQPDYSNPVAHEYMFAYRITIENNNSFTLKLRNRYWLITDSNGEKREVEGEGVVGQQPILQFGESFQYVSGCNLHTEVGKMEGYYVMENLHKRSTFQVAIPPFVLLAPAKLN